MSTPHTPATIRSIYRSLLRELPARGNILSREPTPIHRSLREQFRSTEKLHPRQLAEAQQYAAYLAAQRTYTALIERYNPGMGMDEEERVRLTARRVGMDLPKEFDGSKE